MKQRLLEIKENITHQFDQLEPRTKTLLNLLIISIIFSFAFNTFYKPQRMELYSLKQELNSLNNRFIETSSRIPDVEKEQRLLEKEKISLKVLKEELAALEGQLPHQDSLPDLLGELLRQSEGTALDFQLIRPLRDKGNSDYANLKIEMQFKASYANFVNYLYRLEHISQFINATSIEISEQKEFTSSDLDIKIILSTLLAEPAVERSLRKEIISKQQLPKIVNKRSPFQSIVKGTIFVEKGSEFKLSGIISAGAQPTAIINDEVYRQGEWIGDRQVSEILQERVVLKAGEQDIILTIQRDDK